MPDNEELRSIIQYRILCLTIQLTQSLTPLLRKEMKLVIDLHSAALEEPDLAAERNVVRNLKRVHKQLRKHWCKVYKDPIHHSFLLSDMGIFQMELTGMLLHDYVGKSYSPTSWVSDRAETVRKKNAAVQHTSSDDSIQTRDSGGSAAHKNDRSDSDSDSNNWRQGYHDGIVFPLEEMTLDVAHAEERLLFAGTEQQERVSGVGYVTELIRRTDWKKLAETLLHDRQLVRDLSLQPMIELFFDDKKSRKVLDGIKRIEHKYFVVLSSPTTYTISKRAMELSARHSSNSCICASLPLAGSAHPRATDLSGKDRARGVFSAITGGFKALGRASPKENPRASLISTGTSGLDEKARLVDLEDS